MRRIVDVGELVDEARRALESAAAALPDERLMMLGRDYGCCAGEAEAPLPGMVCDIDGVEAGLLGEIEAGSAAGILDGGAALDRVRRLRRVVALLRASAIEGYAETTARNVEKRFRRVRHDLLNHVGTIRNALSLIEERLGDVGGGNGDPDGARFAAMATRATRTLESDIRTLVGTGPKPGAAGGAAAAARPAASKPTPARGGVSPGSEERSRPPSPG